MNWNELMSEKHKKVCKVFNCIEHSRIVISTITGYVPISAFASLVWIPIGIASSAMALRICLITSEIKKYNSINKKNKKRHMIK